VSETWQEGKGWLVDEPKGGLVKRYLSGNVAIALRRRKSAGSREPIQNGLIFQHLIMQRKSGTLGLDREGHNPRLNRNQPLVFTPYIELMEGIKEKVTSFVGFEWFDSGLFALGEPLFAFDSDLGVDEIVQGAEDWKVGRFARLYAVACGQGGGEQVEAASDRVNNGTDFSVDNKIKRFLRICDQEL
jgi:hypothetical protein